MQQKEITVVLYGRRQAHSGLCGAPSDGDLNEFLNGLASEVAPLGISLRYARESETILEVRGYGDLLNTVRIRSPQDSIGNLCLGHIIGPSPNRNFYEDLRRGVSRVAFAPETIEPEGSHKVVCHNCGCGC